MIRPFRGVHPQIDETAFIADSAQIIGDVHIGKQASVWYGTVVRGDVMPIRVGARTNLQDGTIVHVTAGKYGTVIGSDCTIGHGAILHACTVEDHCLIGMGATVLDGVVIGCGSFIGAGALVTPGTVIPPGSLAIGSPARVKRPVSDAERAQIEQGAARYVELSRRYLAGGGGSSVP